MIDGKKIIWQKHHLETILIVVLVHSRQGTLRQTKEETQSRNLLYTLLDLHNH